MSEQLYIENGWLCEPCEPDYDDHGNTLPGSWSKPLVNLRELEGYDAEIAAAEQRGAARGWDEVADNLGEYAEVDDSLIHLADNIRGANPYRADQMEGDDD